MNSDFIGNRWHKCDLHLHTPASLCFRDRSVTAKQWVQEALDKGLNCVAVTDHNTNEWIDPIKAAAEGTGLTVFPGVEITCSDAKVHLLILFDKDKTGQDVYDFLLKSDIERNDFGQQDAHTNKNIEEIARLAHERGALIIPAHIDEFNGICQVGNKILKDFLELPFINAVQVVHQGFIDDDRKGINKELKGYYGRQIEEDRIKTWRTAVRESQARKKAILTFSDNPHEKGDSKHGLWGMGRRYTWIKMEAEPRLEGLRQAFLSDEFRIKNDFDCPDGMLPFSPPKQWLKKLVVRNTEVTHPEDSIEIEFSPQLTTIIGGRGSGKSTVLRFIRSLFQNKVSELKRLGDNSFVYKDFQNFFRIAQGGVEGGVLKEGTVITLYCQRHGTDYKVEYKQVSKHENERAIHRFDSITGKYSKDESEGLIDLFEFDIFSQKQIYDIGTKTNSLRDRIDSEVPEIAEIKNQLEELRNKYYEKSTEVRSIQSKVAKKAKLQTEIADLQERRGKLFKGNQLLKERELFEHQEEMVESVKSEIEENLELLEEFVRDFSIPGIEQVDSNQDKRLAKIFEKNRSSLKSWLEGIKIQKEELKKVLDHFLIDVQQSSWHLENETSKENFEKTKEDLVAAGYSLEDIERVNEELGRKKRQVEEIEKEEDRLSAILTQKEKTKKEFFKVRGKLTRKRKDFLSNLLKNSNVKATVAPYRDAEDFENQLRKILNTYGYRADFDRFKDDLLRGKAEENCQAFIERVYEYRKGGDRELFPRVDGRLLSSFKGLEGQQLDNLDLLAPEDEIKIEYKPNTSSSFKPISNLSPGQKTASILTILLTHKDTPLILDQPEDDLDSFLIYDLIVEQLKRSKEFRQIIVVSHNANIPVNGDSEHIIIMNSESKLVEKMEEGSIDKREVKEFVLKVMEGGKAAFDYRSKRYKVEN